jgi:5-oxoprolinase (ATP-hydrolysing)
MAAVLYVFRTLVDDEIPMNQGCLKPLRVIVPEGSMLNPRHPAAGRGGQRRDLHLHHQRAVRRAGRDGVVSQPTINNFTFGNARYQYYETVSGGSGAGGVFDASGRWSAASTGPASCRRT